MPAGMLIQRRLGLNDPGLSAIDGAELAPLFDLDFTQGRPYAHRIINKTAATATRASSANRYWLQPADDVGVNVLRYAQNSGENRLNGLLIEGADQNVVLQNTVYAAGNWTNSNVAQLAVSDDTSVDLYGGRSFKWQTGGFGTEYLFQTVALTAADYILCALVYIDGALSPATQFRVAAGATGAIAALATTFEHLGGGVYLAWASFTATAANWDIGAGFFIFSPMVGYFSLLSCYLAAPANEAGDFPRSPIPNATGAAITRAADVYTHPADNNIGLSAGTIDVEFVAPCSEAEASVELRPLWIYKDGANEMGIGIAAASNRFYFYHEVGAAGRFAIAASGFSRGDIVKARAIYDSSGTLDGTNYSIMYVDRGAGWSQLAVNAVALGGAFPAGATINIGRSGTGTPHLGSFIRRVRIFSRAIVGVPAW